MPFCWAAAGLSMKLSPPTEKQLFTYKEITIMENNWKLETLAVQAGYTPGDGDARIAPIVQSTTFRYDNAQSVADLFDLKKAGFFYTRLANPTVDCFEKRIAALEGGVAAVAVSSGQTGNFSALANIAQCGDHIVAIAALYGGTVSLFSNTMKKFGIGSIPCFIVGSGDLARQIVQECENSAFLGCRVVGSFDDGGKSIPGVERLGGLRDVVRMGRAMDVKRLLACYDERLLKEQLTALVKQFQFIDYFPTRRAFPVIGSRLVAVGGFGGIELVNQSCMKVLRWEKSAMDFLLSVAAILVCLPLFILIPVLIKLTSRGPVFYRHHRLGKGGRTIKIWKFRSMYMDSAERLAMILGNDPAARAEWEENFKLKNDPRITPFGRFLRKTSLDEIPQLFNVLLGEMAIVGPRPIVEDEVRYYGGRYELFSRAKPGITGLWQVSGRSDTGYDRRVSLDCYYVLNWNPWMDLWVIMRTVSCVLLMRGAH